MQRAYGNICQPGDSWCMFEDLWQSDLKTQLVLVQWTVQDFWQFNWTPGFQIYEPFKLFEFIYRRLGIETAGFHIEDVSPRKYKFTCFFGFPLKNLFLVVRYEIKALYIFIK